MLKRIVGGRTDLVFEYTEAGHAANSCDSGGVSLLKWCAYYGDVSAIRFLLSKGESLESLGANFDLNGAAFHGHWQLCQFLIEKGADVNHPLIGTGETPLHAALCKNQRLSDSWVLNVLLTHGANPHAVTQAGVITESFMRDIRTKAETPLHRAAAFGTEDAIQLLLDAGAMRNAKDANGDSPLSWASWHLRSESVLRKLCYGDFKIRVDRTPAGLEAHLLGTP
jgi:palmitoyltransferase